MDNLAKNKIAADTLNSFDHFDVDRNGFLNLLEIEKMETDMKPAVHRDFLTEKYLDILSLEDDGIHRQEEDGFGITKNDLLTLQALTSGQQKAIDTLSYNRTSDGRILGGALGLSASMSTYALAPMFAEGALADAVLAVPLVVGFPVALVGGAVLGAGAGYLLSRNGARNYYEQKKRVVDSL